MVYRAFRGSLEDHQVREGRSLRNIQVRDDRVLSLIHR